MSKKVLKNIKPVSQPAVYNPTYTTGEKVYYTVNGMSVPATIMGVQTNGSNGTFVYTVSGDITANNYPAGVASGPFFDVTVSQLSDRT